MMSSTMKAIRVLNTLWIFILCFVLTGAMIYRFAFHEDPCPLCLLQRFAMIGTGIAAFMNLRFGIKPQNYALALAFTIFGGSVSLRQISLHICPQFSTFGSPVWGLELFTWAFLVFAGSLAGLMVLLFLQPTDARQHEKPHKLHLLEKAAGIYLFIAALYNAIMIYFLCGLSACAG